MNDVGMAKASAGDDAPKPFAELGQRVARARREAGLTQAQLAQRFGKQSTQASRWELGINRCPDKVLEVLAELAKVDLGWLMTGQGTPIPSSGPKGSGTSQYQSLQGFLARHRDMKVTEDERSWLASQRFARSQGDLGDDEWWIGQLIRYRDLVRRSSVAPGPRKSH